MRVVQNPQKGKRLHLHHLESAVSSGWKAVAKRCPERTATATFSGPWLAACSSGVNLGACMRVLSPNFWAHGVPECMQSVHSTTPTSHSHGQWRQGGCARVL
jgi:hypothetical protein